MVDGKVWFEAGVGAVWKEGSGQDPAVEQGHSLRVLGVAEDLQGSVKWHL